MFLQSLSLLNIRSYTKQTIEFKKGSTLLSGDIGSGKSTILLAIEFALFGTSRPDLPSELLLRSGASSGSVELTFELDNNIYKIERHLKKEKESIKQTNGSISKNGTKKELTPVELKSEVIHLLGYPEDLASKNKNYLFRYTLYTPQEEMKLILEEDEELRLQILRRLFNLDKYQTIRENINQYLKKVRSTITVLETRLEPYRELQSKLQQIEDGITTLKIEQEQRQIEHQKVEHSLSLATAQLLEIECTQKYLQSLFEEIKTTKALLREKEEQISATQNQLLVLDQERQLLRLPQDGSENTQREIIHHLEIQKEELLASKTIIEQRLLQIQRELKEHKPEIDKLTQELATKAQDEQQIARYKTSLERKPALEEEKTHLANILEPLRNETTKGRTIIDQARNLQERVRSLEDCPTCMQIVTPLHKHTIIQTEQEKITQIEEYLKQKEHELKITSERLT